MKIAILANDGASFVKPMADSLAKMFLQIGEEPSVYYRGEHFLRSLAAPHFQTNPVSYFNNVLIDIAKTIINPFFNFKYKRRLFFTSLHTLDQALSTSDVIIVVTDPRTAFRPVFGIEELRRKYGVPIVLYINVNVMLWPGTINRNQQQRGLGLERYDWYLYTSSIHENSLPRSYDVFSVVGIDLRSNTLFPDQKDFFSILDFPRKGFESERTILRQALEETNTCYYQLDRAMTIEEIRKLYRRSCIFFISFEETFGLPIVELQLCGSYIGTPFKHWVPSHYINKNVYEKGEGDLGTNFIVYNNDKETLKQRIIQIRSNYNPRAVIKEFADTYPHLYRGDIKELQNFVDLVRRGVIHADSHRSYDRFN